MAEFSNISWTTHTWNPWAGCTKVSAGCDNCYAETLMDKRMGFVNWGAGNPRHKTKTWNDPIKWNKKAAATGEKIRVFCASLADIFDPEVPAELRREALNVIDSCPFLDWLLLTKRPQLIRRLLIESLGDHVPFINRNPNIIWGTTIENQEVFSQRSEALWSIQKVFGVKTFYSVEPLLEDVNLFLGLRPVSWVIVGGESGVNARPFNLQWARNILHQCKANDTAFFFKQTGSNCWDGGKKLQIKSKGAELSDIPEELRIRLFYDSEDLYELYE